MKTDYIAHDREYLRRRARGDIGWNDAETIADNAAILTQVFAAPHFPRSGRLLEMGCGAGDMALGLAALGYDVSGVDIAPAAIAWANDKAHERGLTTDFRVGDVLDLADYAADSFDMALDGHCLHCIIGDDRAKFLVAARRVLKPGGLLHVNTMCGNRLGKRFINGFDPVTRCQVFNGIAYRYWGQPEDILAEVRAAGLEIIGWQVNPNADAEDMLRIDARKPSD